MGKFYCKEGYSIGFSVTSYLEMDVAGGEDEAERSLDFFFIVKHTI